MMISQMNQSQLLHWIDMVSFAVVEITEYLDTHPDDEEALKYWMDAKASGGGSEFLDKKITEKKLND